MSAKQYPKSDVKKFWIQRINPLSFRLNEGVGGSDDIGYAIRRCKELAEGDRGKSYLAFYRVIEHRGEVIFLSHVNIDKVTHYDMREANNGSKEENSH